MIKVIQKFNFKKIILITIFLLFIFFSPKKSFATRYNLVLPSGTFERGQNYDFTINIDTQGATVNSGAIGVSYDTQYLEYVSVTAGETMTEVSSSPAGDGRLILNGTNSNGFNGTGIFAKITFKLIAQAPGETEICVLWSPEEQPTPTPTTISKPPQVTSLPTSGNMRKTVLGIILGTLFFFTFGSFFILNKKNFYCPPKK